MDIKPNRETIKMLNEVRAQRYVLSLQLQVQILTNLVEQLDPKHEYSFDMNKGKYTKTRKDKDTPEVTPPVQGGDNVT